MDIDPDDVRPAHISEAVWDLTLGLSPRQMVGQLVSMDHHLFKRRDIPDLRGETPEEMLEHMIAEGRLSVQSHAPEPRVVRRRQEIAISNGQIPIFVADNGQRGVRRAMPSGAGMTYAWDPELVYRCALAAGQHLVAKGVTLNWAPTADHAYGVCVQGRAQEGPICESPTLMRALIAAYVRGYQDAGMVAVLKHVGGGYQYTDGVDYTTLPISWREFLESCWPGYEGGLDAGAFALMLGFGHLDGLPAHADPRLRDMLLDYGGMRRIIVTDFAGIGAELCEYGLTPDLRGSALKGFRDAHVHIDLSGGVYAAFLEELYDDGEVPLRDLQLRAADVVSLKERIGLLDDPYRFGSPDKTHVLLENAPDFAEAAATSIVLLRPEQPDPSVLPLPGDARVLVCGPLANAPRHDLGWTCGDAWEEPWIKDVVTPFAGLRGTLGEDQVACIPGVDFEGPHKSQARACEAAQLCSHVVVCLGEHWEWGCEAQPRLRPELPAPQVRFLELLWQAARGTKTKIIVSITASRRIHIPPAVIAMADALMWRPQGGTYAGTGFARVLAGQCDTVGRLSHALPRHADVRSGFSYREHRRGRPPFGLHDFSRKYLEQNWCARPQELSLAYSEAEFFCGEGYSMFGTVDFGPIELDRETLRLGDTEPLIVRAKLRATGDRPIPVRAQLYWHDVVAPVIPRYLELLDHRDVQCAPGEATEVSFLVSPEQLATYGLDVSEGRKPRSDQDGVRLFLVPHAGVALGQLFRGDEVEGATFTLTD